MTVRISCKCGCTYRTEVDGLVLAVYPSISMEKAKTECPDCGFIYTKKWRECEEPERHIDMLNDPYFKEHFE